MLKISNLRTPIKGLALKLGVATAVLLATSPLQAAVYTLNDNNSTAIIDADNQSGMFSWTVDGQDQLNQQWFWYRVGNGLAASIDTISASALIYNDANTLITSYTHNDFVLQITYILTGGGAGSGDADILESISVQNTSNGTLDFHLFQYSDFNLLGTPGGDSVVIQDNDPPPGYDYILQFDGATDISETINDPDADRAEVDSPFNTINNLNTIAGYNLNNTLSGGPGDMTWALQWNRAIAAGTTFDVFKDKRLSITNIPEPTAASLLGLALGAWVVSRRKK